MDPHAVPCRAAPSGDTPSGDAPSGDAAAGFAASAEVIAVRAAALGGEVVLLAGAAADMGLWVFERPRWRGCVVYQGRELAALAGLEVEELRMLHALKKAFGGEVTW